MDQLLTVVQNIASWAVEVLVWLVAFSPGIVVLFVVFLIAMMFERSSSGIRPLKDHVKRAAAGKR
jgi:hypothetical protein